MGLSWIRQGLGLSSCDWVCRIWAPPSTRQRRRHAVSQTPRTQQLLTCAGCWVLTFAHRGRLAPSVAACNACRGAHTLARSRRLIGSIKAIAVACQILICCGCVRALACPTHPRVCRIFWRVLGLLFRSAAPHPPAPNPDWNSMGLTQGFV